MTDRKPLFPRLDNIAARVEWDPKTGTWKSWLSAIYKDGSYSEHSAESNSPLDLFQDLYNHKFALEAIEKAIAKLPKSLR